MGKKSPPPAPDYTQAAQIQAQSSKDTTQQQTVANRPNIVTPWGTQTWERKSPGKQTVAGNAMNGATFNEAAYMAANPDVAASGLTAQDHYSRFGKNEGRQGFWNDIEQDMPEEWTQTTVLSPEQQAALNDQMAIQSGRSQGALQLLDQATGAFQKPLDYSSFNQGATGVNAAQLNGQVSAPGQGQLFNMGGQGQIQGGVQLGGVGGGGGASGPLKFEMDNTAGEWRQKGQDAALAFQQPLIDRRRSQLESQLANMGLTRGSEAWNAELQRDSDQAMRDQLQAFGAGQSEANMLFNQDLQSGQFTNNARNMEFNQSFQNAQLGQQAQIANNQFSLAGAQFGNQAQQQAFSQALQGAGFNNAEQQRAFQNQMAAAQYGDQQALSQMQAQMQAGGFNQNIRQQQIAEALAQRAQPLNELNALLTGQQVSMPNMPQFNAAGRADPINAMGVAQAQYGAQADAYNAQQAQQQAWMNGLFMLGGGALAGSHPDYKQDVELVGTHPRLGIGIYTWEYKPQYAKKWGAGRHIGVMADELAREVPDAITYDDDGDLVVDYSKVW